MIENVDFIFADEMNKPVGRRVAGSPRRAHEEILVLSGLKTSEQIVSTIGRYRADKIEELISKKKSDESAWPLTTDVDKLEMVFASLSQQHILDLWALDGESHEDWLWDAEYYVDQFHQCVGGEASGYSAAVYYTMDDLSDAIDHGVLALRLRGFEIENDWTREQSAASARMALQETLSDMGLDNHWNKAIPEIVLVRLTWQRRHPVEPVESWAERQMTPFSRMVRKKKGYMGYRPDEFYHR